MPSSLRAAMRRKWREDRKNMSVSIPWRAWTPSYFDEVKRKIRVARERAADPESWPKG